MHSCKDENTGLKKPVCSQYRADVPSLKILLLGVISTKKYITWMFNTTFLILLSERSRMAYHCR